MKLHFWSELRRWLNTPTKAPAKKGRLTCTDCGSPFHRHDHYVVTAAHHRNCQDPTLSGAEIVAPRLFDGEPVIMPARASMGSEMLDPYQNGADPVPDRPDWMMPEDGADKP